MYNPLRPRASSGEELAALADRLEDEYGAPACTSERASWSRG